MSHCESQGQKVKEHLVFTTMVRWQTCKTKVQRWCQRTVNNKHFEMCNCGCTQTGKTEASRPVGSQGVVWTDRPLSPTPPPPPACFLISPFSKLLGWSRYVETSLPTRTHTFPLLPISSSCLISMQPARWYSNSVLCYDLINGIWLPAWIPETGMAFWNSEDGRGGRRGSCDGRDAWWAEAESCQLGSGSPVSL